RDPRPQNQRLTHHCNIFLSIIIFLPRTSKPQGITGLSDSLVDADLAGRNMMRGQKNGGDLRGLTNRSLVLRKHESHHWAGRLAAVARAIRSSSSKRARSESSS